MMENLQSISSRPVAEAVPSGYGGRKVVDKSPGIQGDTLDLSPEAEAQLRKLKQRDAEVRAHERAHMAAAGGNAVGGPHYEYQKGPDGKQYAIGGHVDISLSSVDGDPEENEKNAQEVRRAALAPGQPSGQDRAVAAQAASMEAKAKTEKLGEKNDEQTDENSPVAEQKIADRAKKNFENAGDTNSPQENSNALMRKAIGIYNEVAQTGTMKTAFGNEIPGLAMAV